MNCTISNAPEDWVDYTVHETLSSDLEFRSVYVILFSSTLVSSAITVIQTVFLNIVWFAQIFSDCLWALCLVTGTNGS